MLYRYGYHSQDEQGCGNSSTQSNINILDLPNYCNQCVLSLSSWHYSLNYVDFYYSVW